MAAKVEKEIAKTLEVMKAVKQEVESKKEVSHQVKQAKAAMLQNENEMQHLAATIQHHRRQHNALQERIGRIEAQGKLKFEAAASSVEERLRDKEALEAEALASKAKVSENDAMMRSLKQQLVALKSSHSGQVEAVMAEYRGLLADVTNYNRKMVEAMQSWSAGGGQ
eukprot:CAMPEP_0117683872 /NCGR_PEP_ID=MMETSP0804-20121206/20704_1 /TAXON_ID=1074897 /ORGANISM="Tetraselmis astigmatica, Strain CCMP880" /LENGTH=166 /DNA_ID=CAMNT_0005494639 /DNA_START=33 /DNA_END=533 /DNA_ORIENTATION=+